MLSGIDHLVVLVADLAQAADRYGRLGFTVVPGGRHSRGTHNALVAFADGSYLELIAFFEPYPEHRWWPVLQRGGGIVDVCLRTTDFAVDLGAFARAGLPYAGPVPFTRVRPDGYTIRWVLGFPPAADLGVAPFLIEDETPRAERVPAATDHPNGVTGIAAVTIAAADPARMGRILGAVAGRPAEPLTRPDLAASGVAVAIGPHRLEYLVLEGRIPGPRAATLTARPEAPRGPLDPALTMGARLAIV